MAKIKKFFDRSALDDIQPGFYILTHDVKNPKPNRRYKSSPVIGTDIVPAGLRVQAVKYPIYQQDAVTEKCHRTELRHYGTSDSLSQQEECPLAQMVAPLLKPAEPALGHYLNDGSREPKAVLAALIDQGKITFEDIKGTYEVLDNLGDGEEGDTEESWSSFLRRHWVDRLCY